MADPSPEMPSVLGSAERLLAPFGIVAGVAALSNVSDGTVDWIDAIDKILRGYRVIVDFGAWIGYGWVFQLIGFAPPRRLADLALLLSLSLLAIIRADAPRPGEDDPRIANIGIVGSVAASVLSLLCIGYFYALIYVFVWVLRLDGNAIEDWFVGILTITYLGAGLLVEAETKTGRLRTLILYYSSVLAFGAVLLINATLRQWFGWT